jgi:amino acid permease
MIGLFGKESLETVYNGIFISRTFWMLAFLVLIIPLCFAKSVDDFSWFSGLALLCAIYLAVLIILESLLLTHPANAIHVVWFRLEWKTIECVPIFIFAFTCHQNIFTIYKDLDASYLNGDPLDAATLNHIYSVIDLSVIGVGSIYGIVGWLGFLLFGDQCGIIILDNCEFNLKI